MLHIPIRYINNGEPLDQETLNRDMYDVQENLEELFRLMSGGDVTGEVSEIPNTFVLRDQYGTTQFATPRVGANPLRQQDVVDSLDSTATNRPLSANMGSALASRVGGSAVPVRQTVLAGPVDTSGHADFLESAGGLTIRTKGNTSGTPIVATFGDGFGEFGQSNLTTTLDTQYEWQGLPANSTVFLYMSIDNTGSVSTGHTVVEPLYSQKQPASTTDQGFWYPTDHRTIGAVYSGGSWTNVHHLFVGECVTSASSVSSVTTYSLQGYHESIQYNITPSGNRYVDHNIGVRRKNLNFFGVWDNVTSASVPYDPPSGSSGIPISNIYERGNGFYGVWNVEHNLNTLRLIIGNMRIAEVGNSTGYLSGDLNIVLQRNF